MPGRSVLITFDDGTHGLWTHADKILERHGMHGVSFLITGNVGAKRPYYLSWQEIERMAGSGRWDFQSHTRKMHARLPVDTQGTLASEMTHRRWLFEENRLENLGEFETKIRNDLRGSVQDMVDHGLPRPTLFAFPFSEGYKDLESSDPEAAAVAMSVIREMFVCGFNNAPPQPLPAGARAAAVGMVGRIELTMDSTPEELLSKVRARTPVNPSQAPPSARTDLWTPMMEDFPAPVRANGDEVRLLGPGSREGIAYGRHATADWASYQASVTISGLPVYGVENAALVTRIGTGKEVSALVNSDFMRLSVGLGANPVVMSKLPLPPNDQHTVAITVSPSATEMVVDGSYRLTAPADNGPDSYGGIGSPALRTVESATWPVFTGLSNHHGAGTAKRPVRCGRTGPGLTPFGAPAGKFDTRELRCGRLALPFFRASGNQLCAESWDMSATGDRPAAVQRALGPRSPRPPRPRADSHRRQGSRVPPSRSLNTFPTSTGSKRATSTSPALLTTSSSRRPSWSHTGSRNPNSSPTRCLPTPTIPKIALWRQCFRRQSSTT